MRMIAAAHFFCWLMRRPDVGDALKRPYDIGAVRGLSPGSLARQRRTMSSNALGTSERRVTTRLAVRVEDRSTHSPTVSPSKASLPVTISNITAPNENRSLLASTSFARHLLRRHVPEVPRIVPWRVSLRIVSAANDDCSDEVSVCRDFVRLAAEGIVCRLDFPELREAEVEQLRAVGGQHHVRGLQIAVNDSMTMGVVEGTGDLEAYVSAWRQATALRRGARRASRLRDTP